MGWTTDDEQFRIWFENVLALDNLAKPTRKKRKHWMQSFEKPGWGTGASHNKNKISSSLFDAEKQEEQRNRSIKMAREWKPATASFWRCGCRDSLHLSVWYERVAITTWWSLWGLGMPNRQFWGGLFQRKWEKTRIGTLLATLLWLLWVRIPPPFTWTPFYGQGCFASARSLFDS